MEYCKICEVEEAIATCDNCSEGMCQSCTVCVNDGEYNLEVCESCADRVGVE